MDKLFATAEVKAAGDGGEFEAIASAPVMDRDGEVIDAGAFDPLPESVPIHAYHAFSDPIGVGTPYYDGEQLMIRGTFAMTPRAQEMRQLVTDGAVPAVSVGFIILDTDEVDGVKHITSAELLEVSLVSVPALREARVLAVKSADIDLKIGSRNNAKDAERLQQIHDLAVTNGATCKADEPEEDAEKGAAVNVYMTGGTTGSAGSYVVGDQGSEFFIPSPAGTITKHLSWTSTTTGPQTSTDDEGTDPATAAHEAAKSPAIGTDEDGEGDDLALRLRALQLQADAVA